MRKERQIALVERLLAILGKGPEETCREGARSTSTATCPFAARGGAARPLREPPWELIDGEVFAREDLALDEATAQSARR